MMAATDLVPRVENAAYVVDLANNENLMGPSPLAIEAIQREAAQVYRYPDIDGTPLLDALAEHYETETEHFMLGNGSNELIDLIARQWARPGTEVIVPSPSFLPYGSASQRAGAKIIRTGLRDWHFDLDAVVDMICEKTSLIILGNPNNPTGTEIDRGTLEHWLATIPEDILVVLDEAYAEYSSDQGLGLALLKQRENLIVLRTFSKAYGLAGLRIGYAIGSPDLIRIVQSQRQQFNVNRLAHTAALAALKDQDYLLRVLRNNVVFKRILYAGLSDLRIAHVPSFTNFILLYCGYALATSEALKTYRLLVKPLERFGLHEFIRVTIGPPETIERLLIALKEIQSEQSWFPVSECPVSVPKQPCSGEKLWRY
ncbi:MAG: histidinol-phosphate transaminase [Deltaproteobacteria bacterium]|jgi:histidinol-phosphate aminotransferase|nr:histidinol-phosphate transaminase [Deltaproteobacteria bacterium]MBW2504119.1 histidinol-phosphate transaminase [Deltaproteobacteria bacterium]